MDKQDLFLDTRIVIIGGGISGLTAAYYLKKNLNGNLAKTKITVLEGTGNFGGAVGTLFEQDCLMESGPDCFTAEKTAAAELCRDLGIEDQLIGTQPEARTFFLSSSCRMLPFPKDFHLFAPARFKALCDLPFVNAAGKCRMALEPFIPKLKTAADESLGNFFRRRFGKSMVHHIIQPVLGSIFGGNVDRISLMATFPRLRDMELKYGSVVKALRAKNKVPSGQKGKTRTSTFITLKKGMGSIVETLLHSLKDVDLRTFARVHRISKNRRWHISLRDGGEIKADYLCIAAPSNVAAHLVEDVSPSLSYQLAGIPSKSMISVYYAVRKNENYPLPLGSGFVRTQVTGDEKIMGGTFASIKFSGRSPQDIDLIRVFVSPAWCPTFMRLGDNEIAPLLYEELREIICTNEMPIFFKVFRHEKAMPQYEVGHLERVNQIEQEVSKFETLFLTGNAYRGVGVPGCVERGRMTAEEIIKRINICRTSEVME